MAEQILPVVCIPINVDAFILNPSVCDTGLTRIAPITQPDYRGLRPNPAEIQHDILPHVDISRTQPSAVNSRISVVEAVNPNNVDLTSPSKDTPAVPPLRENRIGVYLHWSLPRCYRAATGAADSVTDQLPTGENISSSPTFRLVPNRWLVLRQILSSVPALPPRSTAIPLPELKAWIVESDRLWDVSDFGPNIDFGPETDTETDMSPFVAYTEGDELNPNVLNKQAAVFIGANHDLASWTEQGTEVPRVPLTTMNSSNFSFADNTIHNSNVFSMVDNLNFIDANNQIQVFTQATCNYTIFGWHSDASDDPLGPNGLKGTMEDRMNALFCTLAADPPIGEGPYLRTPGRLLCYGMVSGLQYDRNTKPVTPSDAFASLFTDDVKMEPVSLGTTPLDALLTFLQAHSANEDDIFGTGTSAIAKDILSLRELLYAADDTYNSRSKASDLVYADNFLSSSGGTLWHWAGRATPGGPPAQPGTISIDGSGLSALGYLNKVSDLQLQLDAGNRKLTQMQWSLFTVWWNTVSDLNASDPSRLAEYKAKVFQLREAIQALKNLISTPKTGLVAQIDAIVDKSRRFFNNFPPVIPATKVPLPPFYQRKDPTICIAGMTPGWPLRYLSNGMEVLFAQGLSSNGGLPTTLDRLSSVDPDIVSAIGHVWFFAVEEEARSIKESETWTGQPWCALYIEWEAIYFHIPFEKWTIQLMHSPVGNNLQQLRYGLKDPLYIDPRSTADQRMVSGRTLLTPQPVVSLKALVAQVLDTAGTPQPTDMSNDNLLAGIDKLNFISGELTGLTNNLMTVVNGSHVQPNFHVPGSGADIPLTAATTAASAIGLTAADLSSIGDQSGSTPYGTLVDFSQASRNPFKPVTHGQLRFTKLNIVDKFGQVICGIPPTAEPREAQPNVLPPSLHPCLGDQLSPGLVPGTTLLNTVTELTTADPQLPGGYPLCPYVQLTPSINQPARLNTSFVEPVLDTNGGFLRWKTTIDWEQPVWAWVVVNYADYGLQFFAADGTFFVELSLGGPTGSITTPKWLPFDPPQNPSSVVSPQLLQLVGRMSDQNGGEVYLRSFWDMITQAIETMPYAPADYAAYASSIIGKPLALVNAGISLELDAPPLISQTTLPPSNPTSNDSVDLLHYAFPIKIGDAERPYDGVLGYFDTDNTGNTIWSKLYTYFPHNSTPADAADPRILIEPTTFPTISPFYVDPSGPFIGNSFAASLAAQLTIKTLLIDPYTPLHVYSPILPITALQLPAWSVQAALHKMSAFFKLGPCLVTRDVPSTFDPTKAVEADTWAAEQQARDTDPATAAIRLPLRSGKKTSWSWLQPYMVDEGEERATRYNSFAVGEEDGRIRLDPAPYTLVEGFLQLAQPLAVDAPATTAGP